MTVLDTEFIDHFRGLEAATAYLQSFEIGQRVTTAITIMEIYKDNGGVIYCHSSTSLELSSSYP